MHEGNKLSGLEVAKRRFRESKLAGWKEVQEDMGIGYGKRKKQPVQKWEYQKIG